MSQIVPVQDQVSTFHDKMRRIGQWSDFFSKAIFIHILVVTLFLPLEDDNHRQHLFVAVLLFNFIFMQNKNSCEHYMNISN